MSDYARRAFRMQLGTIMDAVMKTAVCEIAKIFEGSLCEQQLELTQRVEEISMLRGKLDKAERRLRGDAEEGKRIPAVELHVEVETFSKNISTMMTDPDTRDDVPDYWCAPVQSDELLASSSNAGQENECPSVTLKPLTVTLWRMPDIKQEVEDDFEPHLMTALTTSPPGIRMEADCGLEGRLRDSIQQLHLPLIAAEYACGQNPAMLGRIKQEECETTINSEAPTLKRRRKSKHHKRSQNTNMSQMKPPKLNEGQISYKCKFCKRVFETEVGLKVHSWLHKKCPNCHDIFPFPSILRRHIKMCCRVKEETGTTERKPNTSSQTVTPTSPRKKKKNLPDYLANEGTTSANSPKQHTCKHCPRKFRTKAYLRMHVKNFHDEPWKYPGRKRDLVWTVPFEENTEHQTHTTNPRRRHRNLAALSKLNPKGKGNVLETLGKRVSNGYKCKVCKKVFCTKSLFKEHVPLHTDDKPLQCRRCGQSFRIHARLSRHHRICTGPLKSLQCEDCSTTYANQIMLSRHMMDVHKRKPHTCKICGKGFSYMGSLREHYKRLHA
ncbi:zinc finger protein 627-like [Osmerus mordax]|uniref:zinc finger protein 627-like n=1 Tax=Osmerus mordax TaxID=8014 RepID=UPI00350F18F3